MAVRSEATRQCPHCGRTSPRAGRPACPHCGQALPRSARPAVILADTLAGRTTWGRLWRWLTWGHSAAVLLALFAMRHLGERWWLPTLLLHAPRAPWLLPLPALALGALATRQRRLWWLHGTTAVVVLGPVMGLCLPWGDLGPSAATAGGETLRILTLDRGARGPDPVLLEHLIEREQIDIVCFQRAGGDTPPEPCFSTGWFVARDRAVASRHPIIEELPPATAPAPNDPDPPAELSIVRVRLPRGAEIRVASLRLPPLAPPGAPRAASLAPSAVRRSLESRWRQAARASLELIEHLDAPMVVGGDLGMPPDSPMMELLRRPFALAFEQAGLGYGYTYPASWPYQANSQVLASADWRILDCRIGPDLGTGQLPVIADLVLIPHPTPAPTGQRPPPSAAPSARPAAKAEHPSG